MHPVDNGDQTRLSCSIELSGRERDFVVRIFEGAAVDTALVNGYYLHCASATKRLGSYRKYLIELQRRISERVWLS